MRLPHERSPGEAVDSATLLALGVRQWHLAGGAEDARLQEIRDEHGMAYSDVVTVSPATLAGYEEKLAMFFAEHMHDDDEIRFLLEGRGYFDVRDRSDRWVRIALEAGDMISLPAGIYHRFTVDTSNYAKAMRLFVGEPVWTAHNRPADDRAARKAYASTYAPTAKA
eukprot:TRINITY_DN8907_c0_g1_i1.p1 TRINITY_DN8907_c0_g1~~TRINITY_DN8907_c0_g1_i1.p1  ORF type:complete len:177 (-),score=54.23 TRINITY_DN8907_c0_g1_i1:38-538(-)